MSDTPHSHEVVGLADELQAYCFEAFGMPGMMSTALADLLGVDHARMKKTIYDFAEIGPAYCVMKGWSIPDLTPEQMQEADLFALQQAFICGVMLMHRQANSATTERTATDE